MVSNGTTKLSSAAAMASNLHNPINALVSAIAAGLYDPNIGTLIDDIFRMPEPLNRAISAAQSEFSNASSSLGTQKSAMIREDSAFHQAQAGITDRW